MAVQWLDHRGTQIMYLDCRGLESPEMVGLLDQAAEVLSALPAKALVLANVENTHITREFMDRMKMHGKTVFSTKVEKTAIVGVTGLKTVLVNAYNYLVSRNIVPFEIETQALEWLVQ